MQEFSFLSADLILGWGRGGRAFRYLARPSSNSMRAISACFQREEYFFLSLSYPVKFRKIFEDIIKIYFLSSIYLIFIIYWFLLLKKKIIYIVITKFIICETEIIILYSRKKYIYIYTKILKEWLVGATNENIKDIRKWNNREWFVGEIGEERGSQLCWFMVTGLRYSCKMARIYLPVCTILSAAFTIVA